MPSRAIILSLDQLSRRCLGFFGHEWIETPNLDRLASRGVVFDHCFASPAPSAAHRDRLRSLFERMRDNGVVVRQLHEPKASDSDDVRGTAFAQLITEAESALAEFRRDMESSWLLWMESSGIGWPGVATTQFVELYADELDDDLPKELAEIREIEIVYAALLTQFDHLLGGFWEMIDRLFVDSQPLIVLVANHGQSVCEAEMQALFSDRCAESRADKGAFRDELVHVPLVIANATHEVLGGRRQELVTPADLLPTLAEMFGTSDEVRANDDAVSLLPILRNDESPWRSEIFLQDEDGHAAMRTKDVLFVQSDSVAQLDRTPVSSEFESETIGWLWLKPEDTWEVSEVSDQHPERVATLRAAMNA